MVLQQLRDGCYLLKAVCRMVWQWGWSIPAPTTQHRNGAHVAPFVFLLIVFLLIVFGAYMAVITVITRLSSTLTGPSSVAPRVYSKTPACVPPSSPCSINIR